MLRTYRVCFRKNWVCSPTEWTEFFSRLEQDMIDMNDDMTNQSFSNTGMTNTYETIVENVGIDIKTSYPNL